MGLIKAGMGALGGTLADQWKEFFYCDSLDKDVLMVKGQKRTSTPRFARCSALLRRSAVSSSLSVSFSSALHRCMVSDRDTACCIRWISA